MDTIATVKSENLIQDKIQQSFLENLKKDDKTQEILLGLSGGLDSSVLLHLLAKMQSKLNFKLKAIHIHHGLSSSADDWLDFCKKKCKLLDIDIHIEKVKVNKKSSLGIEGEARKLRYQAIKEKGFDVGTEVEPFPLFEVLNGEDSRDYCQRVEPSVQGGKKMGYALFDALAGCCDENF